MVNDVEAAVEAFLKAWQEQDAKALHEATTITWRSMHNQTETLALVEQAPIVGFKIKHVDQITNYLYDVMVTVRVKKDKPDRRTIVCRTIKEKEAFVVGSASKGTWGVNPISALKNLYL